MSLDLDPGSLTKVPLSSNISFRSSQQQRSKHTSFEYETELSKGIQADGKDLAETDDEPVQKCRKRCIRKKRKKKQTKCCEEYPCQVVCLDEEVCRKHSFCVVDGLREHGCKPLYPKGLPWASGKLLYYPGQRPKYLGIMRETPEEISRVQKAKERRKRKAKRRRDAALQSLRQADDEKLCDVVGTSQEMVLLMRALALVTEQRKRSRALKTASTEPEQEAEVNEEGEEEGGEENVTEEGKTEAEGEGKEEEEEEVQEN